MKRVVILAAVSMMLLLAACGEAETGTKQSAENVVTSQEVVQESAESSREVAEEVQDEADVAQQAQESVEASGEVAVGEAVMEEEALAEGNTNETLTGDANTGDGALAEAEEGSEGEAWTEIESVGSESLTDVEGVEESAWDIPEESQMTEEEYWQAYLETLIYPTHKEEYTEAIYEVIISLPEEKPESTLKQKDVECDTLQWFNATYAMFTNGNGDDIHYVGGYNDEFSSRKDYVSDQLDKSWGITDRATAIESIAWLITDGHTYDFADTVLLMDMMGFLEATDEEIGQYFTDMATAGEVAQEDVETYTEFYTDMKEIYEACGENGIDAWDYCRIMQLCGNCYYLGYITMEECLTIQLVVAQAMQEEFDSWTELNDSYYYGYSYWNYGSYMVSFRKMSYDELMEMEDSPYKVLDFDMPLEKFW